MAVYCISLNGLRQIDLNFISVSSLNFMVNKESKSSLYGSDIEKKQK